MMKKTKPTIKDVAQQAGVSVATVSYIINDRKDQKISENTRKRVLQIINMLNYEISPVARSLSTGKSNIIAVYYPIPDNMTRMISQSNFLKALTKQFRIHNQRILILDKDDIGTIGNADAIIAVNVSKELFYEIGNNNYVPLIAVDTIINDELFYQINFDYAWLKSQASSNRYVAYDCCDELKSLITTYFPNAFFFSYTSELKSFVDTGESLIVSDEAIDGLIKIVGGKSVCIPFPLDKQAKTIVDCANEAINRIYIDNHNLIVSD